MTAHHYSWLLLPLIPFAMAAQAAAAARPDPGAGRIDRVFEQFGRAGSPGCALGVMREGRLVYQKGYGLASLEHGLPIRPERTVFDIGSTSKQFTAAATLLLVQDGKLGLDDDIRKYLPQMPDYGAVITVRHLLHHTSGLRDYLVLLSMQGFGDEDLTTDDDALRAIARQKGLNFQPGSRYSYSNTGYFLLGQIVKRISGKTLGEFARERIFVPLGMKDTRILEDHASIFRHRATAYQSRPDGSFGVNMSDWEQAGDGAVQTNLADLAKWDANFYAPKVGGAWLIAQLQQRGTLNDGTAIDYARGLEISEYRGLPSVAHAGAFAGYRAQLVRIPSRKLSVAVLCNLADADPENLAADVLDLYLGPALKGERIREPEPPQAAARAAAPQDGLDALAGRYCSEELRVDWEIQLRDGQLLIGLERDLAPFQPVAPDVFERDGITVRMRRDGRGVTGFTVDTDRASGMLFERKTSRGASD